MASSAQHAQWGKTFADIVSSDLPHLKYIFEHYGIANDPTALITFLNSKDSSSPEALAFTAVLQSTNKSLDSYRATITEGENQLHQLQLRCNEQQTQLTRKSDIIDQLALRPVTASATSRPHRLSKDPDKFTGEEKNVDKRQQEYTNWKSHIRTCFAQDSEVFNTPKRQLLHIIGLLSGNAYENNRTHFEGITDQPDNPEVWNWETATELFAYLDTQFQLVNVKLAAGIQFDQLKQGADEYPNFLATFNNLAGRCEKTNEQKVEALLKKVSHDIALKFSTNPNPPRMTDFDAWATLGQQYYQNMQLFDHNQSQKSKSNNYGHNFNNGNLTQTQNNASNTAGEPMQLDQISKLTDAERNQLRVENRCFYCREPGHQAPYCEKKLKADARNRENGQYGTGYPNNANRGGTSYGREGSSRGGYTGDRGGFNSVRGGYQNRRGGYSNIQGGFNGQGRLNYMPSPPPTDSEQGYGYPAPQIPYYSPAPQYGPSNQLRVLADEYSSSGYDSPSPSDSISQHPVQNHEDQGNA